MIDLEIEMIPSRTASKSMLKIMTASLHREMACSFNDTKEKIKICAEKAACRKFFPPPILSLLIE